MVDVRPAGPDAWKDVAAVMGERGDPARCFCQYFRLRGRQWEAGTRESNRRDLRAQVCDGDLPPGVLAYDGETPIGWCAVSPRTSYPRVVASPNWRTDHPDAWVITCFVVPVGHRRQGIAGDLAAGAADFAHSSRRRGLRGRHRSGREGLLGGSLSRPAVGLPRRRLHRGQPDEPPLGPGPQAVQGWSSWAMRYFWAVRQ
jgi:hypothetical protein